jgi:hypothetical protein
LNVRLAVVPNRAGSMFTTSNWTATRPDLIIRGMRKISFLLALAMPLFATAAELRVPESYPRIQNAVDAATSGDVVVVGPGTYREALDLSGKDITLRSSSGAAQTILDGSGGTTSIVTLRNLEPWRVTVQGFTFRNGHGSLPRACGLTVRKGGAILTLGTRLTVVGCVFEDNGQTGADGRLGIEYGRAIFSCETDLRVEGSRFERNRAVHGGAITIASVGPRESSILRTSFSSNYGGNDSGGALVKLGSFATLTVRDCDFDGNEAGSGGGGAMLELTDRSRVQLERVRFTGNRAKGGGGAMDVLASGGAALAISQSLFDANRAAHGAALLLVTEHDATASVATSDFTGGTASFGGGMNIISSGSRGVELTGCTFAGNRASFGGGLVGGAVNGYVRISGSRFLDNVAEVRPETGFYRDLCFIDGLPPQGNGQYFGGGAELRTQTGGSITVSSSLFAGNSAMRGGGVHASTCAGGTINLVNNTIVSNDGSGAHVRFAVSREPQYTGVGTIRVANTIVRTNAANEIVAERLDTRSDVQVSYSNVEGGYAGAGNFDLPPSFADASGRDYRLAPGSACIDAGDNAALAGVTDDADLDRRPRRIDDPRTPDRGPAPAPVVDVGAYEYQFSAPRRRAVRF